MTICGLVGSHYIPMRAHAFPCVPMRSHAFPCVPMRSHAFPCVERVHKRCGDAQQTPPLFAGTATTCEPSPTLSLPFDLSHVPPTATIARFHACISLTTHSSQLKKYGGRSILVFA
jgi:hypothetical protein